MLILACRKIVEASSFRPVLACPYYPGANGTATAPLLFFDGSRQEVTFSCVHLKSSAVQEGFKSAYQIGAEPRWFAVIVNCIGNVSKAGTEIIDKDAESAAKSSDRLIFLDVSTILYQVAALQMTLQ